MRVCVYDNWIHLFIRGKKIEQPKMTWTEDDVNRWENITWFESPFVSIAIQLMGCERGSGCQIPLKSFHLAPIAFAATTFCPIYHQIRNPIRIISKRPRTPIPFSNSILYSPIRSISRQLYSRFQLLPTLLLIVFRCVLIFYSVLIYLFRFQWKCFTIIHAICNTPSIFFCIMDKLVCCELLSLCAMYTLRSKIFPSL